jgi:hypothetical protein
VSVDGHTGGTREAAALDLVELRALVERYALGADTKRYDQIVDCFTDDATLELCQTPGSLEPTSVHHGAAEIRAAMTNLDAFVATSHLVGAFAVRVEGEWAEGETTCVAEHVLVRPQGRRLITMGIRYDDHFVRRYGHWRMARRRLVLLWQERRPMEG